MQPTARATLAHHSKGEFLGPPDSGTVGAHCAAPFVWLIRPFVMCTTGGGLQPPIDVSYSALAVAAWRCDASVSTRVMNSSSSRTYPSVSSTCAMCEAPG